MTTATYSPQMTLEDAIRYGKLGLLEVNNQDVPELIASLAEEYACDYEQAKEDGYEEGFDDGRAEGYNRGWEDAQDEHG